LIINNNADEWAYECGNEEDEPLMVDAMKNSDSRIQNHIKNFKDYVQYFKIQETVTPAEKAIGKIKGREALSI
jgi:hypothetical protein